MVASVPYDTMNNQLQSVLQDNLTSTGHVEDCAIFTRKDVALRACSSGFMLTEKEMQDLENAFHDCSETRTNGINLKDVHYKIIRADKYSIYGKKDKQGIVLTKTATLILLSLFSEDMYPGVCVEATEKLSDYLREKGK
ncbi:profilin-4-like [Hydractinia symbiolongicarpus]|uniref:profilin-4-like n=1 Tax=Hydractinia symbiolongicarpus TaxID=13093 RepID=UPI00254E5E75|nr:profilin-4-like [Hydractinia symbiolongicarpus]